MVRPLNGLKMDRQRIIYTNIAVIAGTEGIQPPFQHSTHEEGSKWLWGEKNGLTTLTITLHRGREFYDMFVPDPEVTGVRRFMVGVNSFQVWCPDAKRERDLAAAAEEIYQRRKEKEAKEAEIKDRYRFTLRLKASPAKHPIITEVLARAVCAQNFKKVVSVEPAKTFFGSTQVEDMQSAEWDVVVIARMDNSKRPILPRELRVPDLEPMQHVLRGASVERDRRQGVARCDLCNQVGTPCAGTTQRHGESSSL